LAHAVSSRDILVTKTKTKTKLISKLNERKIQYMAELEDSSLRQGSEVNQLLLWKERQAMHVPDTEAM